MIIGRYPVYVFMQQVLLGLSLCALLLAAGCGPLNVQLVPESGDLPLFKRINARVGTVFVSNARSAYAWAGPTMRVPFGEQSIARWQQVFAAMFADPQELPDWPPWRESITGLDGVIELQLADLQIKLGNDINRPDAVSAQYRICLYAGNGAEIRCWAASAAHDYQRSPFECIGLAACLKLMVEIAARQAIAQIMVEAEQDPALIAWRTRIERERRAQ